MAKSKIKVLVSFSWDGYTFLENRMKECGAYNRSKFIEDIILGVQPVVSETILSRTILQEKQKAINEKSEVEKLLIDIKNENQDMRIKVVKLEIEKQKLEKRIRWMQEIMNDGHRRRPLNSILRGIAVYPQGHRHRTYIPVPQPIPNPVLLPEPIPSEPDDGEEDQPKEAEH